MRPRPQMKLRRTLLPRGRMLLLLAYAVGGAVINVAVAWGGAARQGDVDGESLQTAVTAVETIPGTSTAAVTSRVQGAGETFYMALFADTDLLDMESLSDAAPEGALKTMPRWSRHPNEAYADESPENDGQLTIARGWPCRTLRSKHWISSAVMSVLSDLNKPNRRVSGGIVLPSESWRFGMLLMNRALPLIPIWPGFAINTIFYAAILWLLFAAPGLVRRRIRTRRGQCPACAYPVGTSEVCTECGKPLKSRNAETQKAETA